MTKIPQRIAVVGNIAGGKTRLSRSLALRYHLPLTHVDSVQFLPGLKMRPWPETKEVLKKIAISERWLIDGYGPLDLLEERFQQAEVVVFIDLPLWRHRFWYLKRQLKNLFSRREELPQGCDERSWSHFRKGWQSMTSSHRQMRPELLKIFARESLKEKVRIIRTLHDWRRLEQEGL